MNTIVDVSLNVILEDDSLKHALEQLDKITVKVLLVTDNKHAFVASMTDGDVRRAILAGASLETMVSQIANYHPLFLECDDETAAWKVMHERKISALPILDKERKIQKVYIVGENEQKKHTEKLYVPVVIMAGGLGTRLYPYTKILPKPLIPVFDIPISERIIQSFQEIGCEEFHMIVNYKCNMIKAYFNDIDHGYNIHFWDEEIPLGTGGGLYLLKDCIGDTFVLTNCDILILDDVRKMVEHHKKEKNQVTMVCSLKNFTIPYGIVNFSEGGEISSFEEKPQLSFFTNTGYYILEPDIFRYISQNEKIGMPDIIDRMRRDGLKVGIYPISENAWLDMGQFDSMESMERRLKELKVY
ncbi:MAG: NTP transferase domain-containing protein [Lachnospiraceae bacterium]|nr:NTP transferase domain-containing protein [Lachnospiraceae bacterium]